MWCPHCNAETTPVPSKKVDGSCCALCGERVFGSKPSDQSIRQARDIIAKWSASDLLDRISTLPDIPAMPAPHIPVISRVEQPELKPPPPKLTPPKLRPPATEIEDLNPAMLQPDSNWDETHGDKIPAQETYSEKAKIVEPQRSLESATEARTTIVDSEQQANNSQRQPDKQVQVANVKLPHQTIEREQRQAEIEVSRPTSAAAPSSPKQHVDERVADEQLVDQQQHTNAHFKKQVPAERSDAPVASNVSTDANQPKHIAVDSSSERKEQPRQPQMRRQRERTRPEAELNKGLNTVNRKFRIDSPGGADNESNRAEQLNVESGNETNVAGGRIQSNSSKTGKRHRIDDGQPVSELLGTGDSRGRTHARPRRRYIDEAHPATARGPHFQVTPQRRSNFTSMTGQFLAYLGVLGLTIGTAMVIYGHFGGYSDYTPTGWLVTTVAQMMLFLGVINLVSGGMEQTNDEVSQRINTLGEQLFRIEQVTEEVLRGPKINPRRYANPDEEYEDSQREVASVRDRE